MTKPPSPSVPSAITPYRADGKDCTDEIMAREERSESLVRSGALYMEVTIQKLKTAGQNIPVPDAVNFYRGIVALGGKIKIHKIFELVNWRPFWWRFDLRGFAEMCFLDPYNFDKLNYELQYSGDEILLERRCWVFRVTPKDQSKGWHFEGTIWVLPEVLSIIRFQGAFHPIRKIHLPFLVEDFWFSFDSWRREISPGVWAPDFTCTGVDVAKSNFIEPAFRARIRYSNADEGARSANRDNVCGSALVNFPTKDNEVNYNPGTSHK